METFLLAGTKAGEGIGTEAETWVLLAIEIAGTIVGTGTEAGTRQEQG
jgi:hypothetical protein